MPNVDLQEFSRPSRWRKMSLAVWRHPADPQMYGRMEVDFGKALQYAEEESARTGERIAPTHLVIRSIALYLKRHPDANALIRWHQIYQRKRIDIFCHVAIPGKKADLSGVIIRDADAKTPAQIAEEVTRKAREVRKGTDEEFSRVQRAMDIIPSFLYRPVLGLIGLLQYTLNVDLRFLGLPND